MTVFRHGRMDGVLRGIPWPAVSLKCHVFPCLPLKEDRPETAVSFSKESVRRLFPKPNRRGEGRRFVLKRDGREKGAGGERRSLLMQGLEAFLRVSCFSPSSCLIIVVVLCCLHFRLSQDTNIATSLLRQLITGKGR